MLALLLSVVTLSQVSIAWRWFEHLESVYSNEVFIGLFDACDTLFLPHLAISLQ